jgi:hypothetical protein
MNIDESRVRLFTDNEDSLQPPEPMEPNSTSPNQDHPRSPSPRMFEYLHLPDHPYDPIQKQYTYQRNGDGTLFCSGQARPSDFVDGVIQGPRPENLQHARDLMRIELPKDEFPSPPPSVKRLNKPEANALIASSEPALQHPGQPSPAQQTLPLVTGSRSPSLPAEGAQIVHA